MEVGIQSDVTGLVEQEDVKKGYEQELRGVAESLRVELEKVGRLEETPNMRI